MGSQESAGNRHRGDPRRRSGEIHTTEQLLSEPTFGRKDRVCIYALACGAAIASIIAIFF